MCLSFNASELLVVEPRRMASGRSDDNEGSQVLRCPLAEHSVFQLAAMPSANRLSAADVSAAAIYRLLARNAELGAVNSRRDT
jgi:hypothetical protein